MRPRRGRAEGGGGELMGDKWVLLVVVLFMIGFITFRLIRRLR